MLSDENDCSTKEYSFYPLVNFENSDNSYYLPAAAKVCATNPASSCCKSCGGNQTRPAIPVMLGSGCDGMKGPNLYANSDLG